MKQHLCKLFLIVMTIWASETIKSQTPNFNLLKSISYGNYSYAAADAAGNFYLTCRFTASTILVGNITLTNASAGSDDIIVVKYNASGNVVWAKSAGGNSTDYPIGIAVDPNSNVYITGLYESSEIAFDNITLSNSGGGDFFIAGFNSAGDVLWANGAGGGLREEGTTITTDAVGNVYVAGMFFSSSVSFGGNILNNTGGGDAFIVKYDLSGNVIWSKSSQGEAEEGPSAISVDANGNVLVTGYFTSSTASFGGPALVRSGSYSDMFIVKYSGSGNESWSKNSQGSYSGAQGFDVVADVTGNIFVTGGFDQGYISLGNSNISSVGGTDLFIIKYNSNGNIVWGRTYGGADHDNATGIVIDNLNNLYVCGFYRSTSLVFANSVLNNNGQEDIFISKLDNAGNAIWGKGIGGNLPDVTFSISIDFNDNVFLSGTNSSAPMSVDDFIIQDQSVFVGKLNTGCTEDNSPPVITFQNVKPDSLKGKKCNTKIKIPDVQVSDNCGGVISLSWIMTGAISDSGIGQVGIHIFDVGVTTITYTAQDVSGNTSTCFISVTVVNPSCPNSPSIKVNPGLVGKDRISGMIGLNVRVNPNPSVNYFTLKIESDNSEQKVSIRIFDLQRRLIETRINLVADQILQIGNDYRPGVYIAEIIQGNRRRVVKLVKL